MKIQWLIPVLAAGLSLAAGELEEIHEGERKLEALQAELLEAKKENQRLAEAGENLRRTAAVTRSEAPLPVKPAAKPADRILYRFSPSDKDGFQLPEGAEVVKLDGGTAFRITAAAPGKSMMARRTLTVPDGVRLRFRAEVKAEGVTREKGKRLAGIRFGGMFGEDGKRQWPAARPCDGTFDWQEFDFETDIPFGTKRFLLLAGLTAESAGTVWFRNFEVRVVEK